MLLYLEPPDRFLLLAPLIGVACLERLTHPVQDFVVEPQPTGQFGKLLRHLQYSLKEVVRKARRSAI
jgi:hypothetical protein